MPTPTSYRGPQWVLPQLIIGVTECIICFCSLSYSLYVYKTYRTFGKNKTNGLSNSLKFMNLFGIISFLCCGIVHCINIYFWNTFYWEYSKPQTLTWYFTFIFWSFGQFISYLLFLDRIKVSFKDSVYEPTKPTMFFLHLLPMVYILIWSAANFVPFMTINEADGGLERSYLIEFYLSIPILILDILITIPMTYIFTSRLYAVILAQTTDSYNEIEDKKNEFDEPLIITNKHIKMIKISVKITILSVTSLISSLILITFRSISYWNKWGTPLDKVHAIWLQIDTIISCLCLVLFLPKTQKGFDLFCCCCNAILSKLVKKSLYQKTVSLSLSVKTSDQTK